MDIKSDSPCSIPSEINVILNWMMSEYSLVKNDAMREIIKYFNSCAGSNSMPHILSTVNEHSVFHQYFSKMDEVGEKCRQITVVSPFFENDRERAVEGSLLMDFADTFMKKYPDSKMRFFFPAIKSESGKGYKVTAPVNIFHEVCKKYKNTELYVINKEWEREVIMYRALFMQNSLLLILRM